MDLLNHYYSDKLLRNLNYDNNIIKFRTMLTSRVNLQHAF